MTAGTARPIPADFLALDSMLVDWPYPGEPDPARLAQPLLNLGLRNLQAPGWRVADVWDWETGAVDANPYLSPLLPSELALLQKFPPHFIPLASLGGSACQGSLSLGLTDRNLRLTGHSSGDPLVNAAPTLQRAVDAIHAANTGGFPIQRVEMGDQFLEVLNWYGQLGYFLFEELDGPSGQTHYPRIAKAWASAIRQTYPDVQFAVRAKAFGSASGDPVLALWNQNLLRDLDADGNIAALALHLNLPGTLGVTCQPAHGEWGTPEEQHAEYSALQNPVQREAFYNQAFHYLADMLAGEANSGVDLRTSHKQIWISTARIDDPIGGVRHTWAHGLATAALLHSALRQPQVAHMTLHNLTGVVSGVLLSPLTFRFLQLEPTDGVNHDRLEASLRAASAALAPTAGGWALKLFAQALDGVASAAPLTTDSLPEALLWGWLLTPANSSQNQRVLLANLQDTPQTVDFSGLDRLEPTTGTSYQASPTAFITGLDQPDFPEFSLRCAPSTSLDHGTLVLSPSSLTLVQMQRRKESSDSSVFLPFITH